MTIRSLDSVNCLPLVDDAGICRGFWLSGIPDVAVLTVICMRDGASIPLNIAVSKEAEALVASHRFAFADGRYRDEGRVAACVFKNADAGFDPRTHEIAIAAEEGLNGEACRVDATIRRRRRSTRR